MQHIATLKTPQSKGKKERKKRKQQKYQSKIRYSFKNSYICMAVHTKTTLTVNTTGTSLNPKY